MYFREFLIVARVWAGGTMATSLLVAHFALQNTASNSAAKNFASQREGGERQRAAVSV